MAGSSLAQVLQLIKGSQSCWQDLQSSSHLHGREP